MWVLETQGAGCVLHTHILARALVHPQALGFWVKRQPVRARPTCLRSSPTGTCWKQMSDRALLTLSADCRGWYHFLIPPAAAALSHCTALVTDTLNVAKSSMRPWGRKIRSPTQNLVRLGLWFNEKGLAGLLCNHPSIVTMSAPPRSLPCPPNWVQLKRHELEDKGEFYSPVVYWSHPQCLEYISGV